MQQDDLNAAAKRIEQIVLPVLRDVAEKTGRIGDIRGRGAMIAAEFVTPGTKDPDAAAAAAVAKACHAQGVVVLTCGTFGNVIRLLPPLVIGEDLLREGLEVLTAAIEGL
jgi:4-aminobutyrate aminotransferase/(S)-3-amino-2-methylpropionate transaminase